MDEPTPSRRKQWTLRFVRKASPRLERAVGTIAFALLTTPLLVAAVRLLFEGTPIEHALDPVMDLVASNLAYTCLGSVVLGILLLNFAGGRASGPASAAVDRRSLYVQIGKRERRIPRGLILEGLVRPGGLPEVELHLSGGKLMRLGLRDDAEAAELVDALELGPERRRAAIALGDRDVLAWRKVVGAGCAVAGGLVLGAVVLIFTVVSESRLALEILGRSWLLWVLAVTFVVLRWVRHAEITVGSDGLVIKQPWRTRFVSYARLSEVKAAGTAVLLRRANGHVERINGTSAPAAEAVATRATEAMERARRAEPVARPQWLERRGRTLANWRASVAAGLRPSSDYRVAAHAPDDAMRILDDPKAPAEQRIGAALALVGSRSEGAREKVRIAADGCAAEPLRIALTEAANDEPDEASIEAALAEATAGKQEVAPGGG